MGWYIYPCIWLIFMVLVNVGKYTLRGWYGWWPTPLVVMKSARRWEHPKSEEYLELGEVRLPQASNSEIHFFPPPSLHGTILKRPIFWSRKFTEENTVSTQSSDPQELEVIIRYFFRERKWLQHRPQKTRSWFQWEEWDFHRVFLSKSEPTTLQPSAFKNFERRLANLRPQHLFFIQEKCQHWKLVFRQWRQWDFLRFIHCELQTPRSGLGLKDSFRETIPSDD